MAVTATLQQTIGFDPTAPYPVDVIGVLADNAYPVGGYEIDLATLLPNRTVRSVVPSALGGFLPVWDSANSKLMFFQANYVAQGNGPLIEVPDQGDLTDVTAQLTVFSE